MRALRLALVLVGSLAAAEPGWLTAQGSSSSQPELSIFAGPRSIGAGFLRADSADTRRGIGLEAAWLLDDRVAELSATRRWQLTPTRFATVSGTAGLAGHVIPEGRFDLGLGPQIGLNLSLGGRLFSLDVGLLSGAELFTRAEVRFAQRLQLGLRSQLGRFTIGLSGRAGVDFSPGRNFILRADAIVRLGLRAADDSATP